MRVGDRGADAASFGTPMADHVGGFLHAFLTVKLAKRNRARPLPQAGGQA
jgi:hypothetical protein